MAEVLKQQMAQQMEHMMDPAATLGDAADLASAAASQRDARQVQKRLNVGPAVSRRRLQKRLNAIVAIKRQPFYQRAREVGGAPGTPDPSDLAISKRTWERSAQVWRNVLESLAVEEV